MAMAARSPFLLAMTGLALALSPQALMAQTTPSPAATPTPAQQAHIAGMRAQLDAERAKIDAEIAQLEKDRLAITDQAYKTRTAGIQAMIVQLQASQKQAQAWIDSITPKPAAPPPGTTARLTIKPSTATPTVTPTPTPTPAVTPPPTVAPKPPSVSGKDLTNFMAGGFVYVMRAYREWVRNGLGADGKPVVFNEIARTANYVLLGPKGGAGTNSAVDLVKQEFRNGADNSVLPITMTGAEVTGLNLSRVTYKGGRIFMRDQGAWFEVAGGKVIGRFREIDRTSTSVTIADDARRLYLVLQLNDRSIRFGYYGSETTFVLAPMTSVSATFEEPRAVID
jgi:hypothetical protein